VPDEPDAEGDGEEPVELLTEQRFGFGGALAVLDEAGGDLLVAGAGFGVGELVDVVDGVDDDRLERVLPGGDLVDRRGEVGEVVDVLDVVLAGEQAGAAVRVDEQRVLRRPRRGERALAGLGVPDEHDPGGLGVALADAWGGGQLHRHGSSCSAAVHTLVGPAGALRALLEVGPGDEAFPRAPGAALVEGAEVVVGSGRWVAARTAGHGVASGVRSSWVPAGAVMRAAGRVEGHDAGSCC
jgi:hypothetical protein